jgi:uncharacterized protein with FMN-binding domain
MIILIDVVTAWISVFLLFLLSIIFVLRILAKKTGSEKIKKINRFLRNTHWKVLAVIFVIAALIHGFTSSQKIFSLNYGTLMVVITILLALTYFFRKNLKKLWMRFHRMLTVAIIAVLLIHIVDVGGFVGYQAVFKSVACDLEKLTAAEETVETENEILSEEENNEIVEVDTEAISEYFLENVILTDGTFTGEGEGFNPGIVVEITISDNKITNIVVIEHDENKEEYYGVPVETIPQEIIDEQNPVVDVVSGATCTSIGIMEAVLDALSKSIVEGELPELN